MDIVIGAAIGYSYDKIKYWINSLNRSGFTGEKYLLCSKMSDSTLEAIKDAGIKVATFMQTDRENIVVIRFALYYYLLNILLKNENPHDPYRYVIATDVKDVIFQSDPSTWLSNYGYGEIILSSESLRYEDEPWGMNNIEHSFGPPIADMYRQAEIVNCGVLAGELGLMKDLFLNIHFFSRGTISPSQYIPGGGGPDQAALNILMGMNPYTYIKQVTNPWSGWAAQLGTTGDPSKILQFRPKLLHEIPIYKDGLFVTPEKAQTPLTPYAIVHQWDRVGSKIVNEIMEKYS